MKFYWCLSCGRTFLEVTDYSGTCVLTDCTAGAGDLRSWETAQKNHPEYPVTPVPRKSYHHKGRQAHATIFKQYYYV